MSRQALSKLSVFTNVTLALAVIVQCGCKSEEQVMLKGPEGGSASDDGNHPLTGADEFGDGPSHEEPVSSGGAGPLPEEPESITGQESDEVSESGQMNEESSTSHRFDVSGPPHMDEDCLGKEAGIYCKGYTLSYVCDEDKRRIELATVVRTFALRKLAVLFVGKDSFLAKEIAS